MFDYDQKEIAAERKIDIKGMVCDSEILDRNMAEKSKNPD